MSLNISGEKCSLCGAYLFPDDDVVYCPECGAPHHRDCYNSIGHCSVEEFHGTDKQYKKPEPQPQPEKETAQENTVFCSMCGEKYNQDEAACPKCNTPNLSKIGGRVVTIDLTGGVPDDTDIGDGVTVREAKRFVAVNTHRYMPKFAAFKTGKKTSWNWLAFLTPGGWLVSRKMYLLGCIVAAFQIALTMLLVPFAAAVNTLDTSEAKSYMEIAQIVSENVDLVGATALVTAFISSFANIILRVLIAIFGDLIYKNRVIKCVNDIKLRSENIDEAYRKKGGVNFFLGVLGYFAISELPAIIATMLGML